LASTVATTWRVHRKDELRRTIFERFGADLGTIQVYLLDHLTQHPYRALRSQARRSPSFDSLNPDTCDSRNFADAPPNRTRVAMQLKTLAVALLAPALAMADTTTSVVTMTTTATKTISLQRVVAAVTMTYSNATTSYSPTGVSQTTTTTAPKSTTSTGAGVALDAAQYVVFGLAGVAVAALM